MLINSISLLLKPYPVLVLLVFCYGRTNFSTRPLLKIKLHVPEASGSVLINQEVFKIFLLQVSEISDEEIPEEEQPARLAARCCI